MFPQQFVATDRVAPFDLLKVLIEYLAKTQVQRRFHICGLFRWIRHNYLNLETKGSILVDTNERAAQRRKLSSGGFQPPPRTSRIKMLNAVSSYSGQSHHYLPISQNAIKRLKPILNTDLLAFFPGSCCVRNGSLDDSRVFLRQLGGEFDFESESILLE